MLRTSASLRICAPAYRQLHAHRLHHVDLCFACLQHTLCRRRALQQQQAPRQVPSCLLAHAAQQVTSSSRKRSCRNYHPIGQQNVLHLLKQQRCSMHCCSIGMPCLAARL